MKITITYDSIEEMLTYTRIPGYQPATEIDPPAHMNLQSGRDLRAAAPTPNPAFQTAPTNEPKLFNDPQAKAMHEAAQAIVKAFRSPPGQGIVKNEKPAEAKPSAAGDFAAELPPIDEDYRLTVRKELSKLNKAAGTNIAKDLISSVAGCARLTDVPLDKLEALMAAAKAKEAELGK